MSGYVIRDLKFYLNEKNIKRRQYWKSCELTVLAVPPAVLLH